MARVASGKYPTCAREGCDRAVAPGYGGLCPPHAYASGVVNRLSSASTLRVLLLDELERGVTIYSLAKRAGLSETTVRDIARGRTTRVRKATATRLLEAFGNTNKRPAWPVRRRLCALRKIGWSAPELAQELGVNKTTIVDICSGNVSSVYASTYDAIVDFYANHEGDPARPVDPRIAIRRWPRPMDWDDIDNPEECPRVRIVYPKSHHRRFSDSIV